MVRALDQTLVDRDLLRRVPDPTEQQIREGLSGNLCRCTGYENIIRAIQETAT